MPRPRAQSPMTYRCTASNCNVEIKSSLEANLHPLLGCLICRKCYKNYGDGDFGVFEGGIDEYGDDNYCRWCVDGGDLFVCNNPKVDKDRCHYSFCKDCIELNAPNEGILTSSTTKEWFCFACKPDKLKKIREFASKAMLDLNEKERIKNPARQSLSAKKDLSRDRLEKEKLNRTEKKKDTPKEKENAVEKSTIKEKEKDSEKDREKDRSKEKESHRIKEKQKLKETVREKDKSKEKDIIEETGTPRGKESSKEIEKLRDRDANYDRQVNKTKDKDKDKDKEKEKERDKEIPKEDDKRRSEPETIRQTKKDSNSSEERQKDELQSTPSNKNKNEQPIVLPPKEFIKDIKSLNAPNSAVKKRKLTEKVAQDIFTPLKDKDVAAVSSISPRPIPPISKEDLMKRLEECKKVTEFCVNEIKDKFNRLVELIESKEGNDPKKQKLINDEIDSFHIPMREFSTFIKELKGLNATQIFTNAK